MIPLVLVHGFMGGSAQWAAQVEALSDTHEIIALDLPGFGQNTQMPVINTIDGFANWALTKLRELGVTRYNLLGHSMGGMIVQQMARHDQDNIKNLILLGTGALGVLPGRFETIEQSKARAKQDGAAITARRISATWFLENQAARGYPTSAAIAELATTDAIAAGLDAMQSWSGEDFLNQITPETTVIWGDKDRTYSWEQTHLLWASIPNAKLAVIPGCAHAVHAEKPALLNAVLLDVLSV
ncbi:alpha/beta hydrolase [Sulfitobacter sp. SK012]|uniref:alpha/beta fold hydrolase n=1 Tax=Sulfitobacter sp. SK012 TaxID=1389005 RepID=UPI000E0C03DA|nr:alpha/beta hydrolase [Sulfitobacter sp. SK012]AXI47340.1 alpha/beta hydrolase [Sulfitobacter sp. SK012]